MVSILSCTCCMHQTSSNMDMILCIKHLSMIYQWCKSRAMESTQLCQHRRNSRRWRHRLQDLRTSGISMVRDLASGTKISCDINACLIPSWTGGSSTFIPWHKQHLSSFPPKREVVYTFFGLYPHCPACTASSRSRCASCKVSLPRHVTNSMTGEQKTLGMTNKRTFKDSPLQLNAI